MTSLKETTSSCFTVPLISGSFECLALFSNSKSYLSRDERALYIKVDEKDGMFEKECETGEVDDNLPATQRFVSP